MKNLILKLTAIFSVLLASVQVHAQIQFSNLKELLLYSKMQSTYTSNNSIAVLQAKQTILAAKLNIVDFQGSINPSLTKNTQLPVTILPGEALGGQPGSSRELRMGTKHNAGLPVNLDVKLYNPSAWSSLKLADLNLKIVENDAKLTTKLLYENIATLYYNIVQLQEQKIHTEKNIEVIDTLLQIVQNRYKAGLVKQQDVNDIKISLINTKENANQLQFVIEQQMLSLKLLADIPDSISLKITEQIRLSAKADQLTIVSNNLQYNTLIQKQLYAKQNIKKSKEQLLPTVSFVFNNSTNQFSNKFLSSNWVNSQYLGLRLNFMLPNAQTISNISNAKFNYQLATNNTKQAAIKIGLENKQLATNYEKALAQSASNREIVSLQNDSYVKNKNLYKEGLIALDKLLTSYTNCLNAEYNLIASNVAIELAKAKININNETTY
jgi:outer membrane protein TolC